MEVVQGQGPQVPGSEDQGTKVEEPEDQPGSD